MTNELKTDSINVIARRVRLYAKDETTSPPETYSESRLATKYATALEHRKLYPTALFSSPAKIRILNMQSNLAFKKGAKNMYTKVDSTMTIGDLIAGKNYSVVVYCGYDIENDIPKATENKIGSVIGWFKVKDGKIVSDNKTYDEAEPVLFFAEPFEKELVVVVDKKFFDCSQLRERPFGLTEEMRKKEC